MFEWRGLWLPQGERHLIEWMGKVNVVVDGKPTYQFRKYAKARDYVHERHTVVDVGAHAGLWSRVMALDFERVIGFEPVEEHRACWRKNLEGVAHAELHPFALGDKPGMVRMTTGPSSSGDTWVTPGVSGDVIMRTLDSFEFDRVDLLKIDCEGFEPMVLRGAAETLDRCKPVVIVEQRPGHGEKYAISDTAALPWLEQRGYTKVAGIQGDYILVPPGHPAQTRPSAGRSVANPSRRR